MKDRQVESLLDCSDQDYLQFQFDLRSKEALIVSSDMENISLQLESLSALSPILDRDSHRYEFFSLSLH